MDSLTAQTPAQPATPREAPLAMPVQSLRSFDRRERRSPVAPRHDPTLALARLIIFGGAAALTAYGAREMYGVVAVGEITTLEWALVALFVVNFAWIALAFTSSVYGFVWLLRAPSLAALPQRLESKTAVVMPIYNEAPARVFAALQAICEDVRATGLRRSRRSKLRSDCTGIANGASRGVAGWASAGAVTLSIERAMSR